MERIPYSLAIFPDAVPRKVTESHFSPQNDQSRYHSTTVQYFLDPEILKSEEEWALL